MCIVIGGAVVKKIEMPPGVHTLDECVAILNRNKIFIDSGGYKILANLSDLKLYPERIKPMVVVVSVEEMLEKKERATLPRILSEIEKFGLKICPPEIILLFRLQYKDQPVGERIIGGTLPVVNKDDGSFVFPLLENQSGKLCFNGFNCSYDCTFSESDLFLFLVSDPFGPSL